MTNDPLVIFTPSGKRGRFAVGTPILTAARQLGVDLDSVCGGRGICSKCQITPSYGEFPKHGVTVHEDALSVWNAVEERYDQIRGLKEGRRLGCQATVQRDVVIDVPPESQVHRQVVRKAAAARDIVMDPAFVNYAVYHAGLPTPRIAIGDNLPLPPSFVAPRSYLPGTTTDPRVCRHRNSSSGWLPWKWILP